MFSALGTRLLSHQEIPSGGPLSEWYQSRMRKLLRIKGTQKFVGKSGEWTEDLKLALDFAGIQDAVTRAEQIEQELELYYCFGGDRVTNWDFVVPVEQLSIPGSTAFPHLPRDTRSSD